MNSLRSFFNKHENSSYYIALLLALVIMLPIIGWEHMGNNLLTFYNGDNADEKFIAAWITIAMLFIVGLIKDGNWKVESNTYKGVAGLFLAYYIFMYTKDDLRLNSSYDNWFSDTLGVVANLLNTIGEHLPDWFYADGWMCSWLIIRFILGFILNLILIYFFPPFMLSIPLYLLYELWHRWKDQASSLYEMIGILFIYPSFFYLSLWITYNFPAYDSWLSRTIYLICTHIVLIIMTGYRHRCPQCGSSKIDVLSRRTIREAEQHIGHTDYYDEYSDGRKVHKKTTQNYIQYSHHFSKYRCKRCYYEWWQSHTSKDKYER